MDGWKSARDSDLARSLMDGQSSLVPIRYAMLSHSFTFAKKSPNKINSKSQKDNTEGECSLPSPYRTVPKNPPTPNPPNASSRSS